MTGLGRKLWRVSAAVFAVTVIVLAVLVGLFRLALTQVPERREQIRAWAAEAVGLPVELGSVDGRLGLRGPELVFTGARILAAEGDSVLIEAREGAITLDLLALATGRIVPGRILLSGVSVTLLRGEDGTWQLLGAGGPALAGGEGGLPRLASLPVSEVRLADLDVRFEDRKLGLGPWEFRVPYVDMAAEGDGATLEASVGLPAALGSGLRVEARMTGQDEAGLPLGWSARVDAHGLAVSAGQRLAADAPWYPAAGRVDAGFEIAGSRLRPERFVGQADVRDLAAPGEGGPEPYDRVAVSFDWSGGETGWQLRLSDLDVRRAGRRWRSPTARLEVGGTDAARVVYADADFLRLEDVAPFAALLAADRAAEVAALAPRGGLRGVILRSGPVDGEGRALSVEGELERVGFDPLGKLPGLNNLSGRLLAGAGAGRLEIDSRDAELLAPELFREPLRFSELGASVAWTSDDRGLEIEARELAAANADVSVEGQARLAFPEGDAPSRLEIHARARDVDASAASRYLPVGIMPDGVVAWLDRGIVSGRVPEAVFELRGPGGGFPYRDDEGVFRVSFGLEDFVLDFAEGWPRAEGLRAEVLFENEAFFADVSAGRLMGLQAGPVAVQIPDLKEGMLSIEGRATGPAAAAREWALATDMLERILGPGLGPAQVQAGRMEADVDLLLPLGHLQDNDVRVDLALSGVDVQFDFLDAPVEDLAGRVNIHGASVTGQGLAAAMTGRPVSLSLGPTPSGATRLSLSGRAAVATLDTLFGLDFTGRARGETAYEGYLEFPGPGHPGPFNLSIASDLAGVAIDLPAPLGKSAAETLPTALAVAFPSDGVQDWRIDTGPGLVAAFRLEAGDGGLRLGRVADPPEGAPRPGRAGVVLGGRLSRLALSDWIGFEPRADEAGPDDAAAAFAGAGVRIDELELPTGRYRDVSVVATLAEDTWDLALDGEAMKGRLRIPARRGTGRRIEGDLARLDLFPPQDGEAEEAAEAGAAAEAPGPEGEKEDWSVSPETVPAMFVMVEDLRLGGIRLGAALLDIVAVPGGFELQRFDGGAETFKFTAQGRAVRSAEEDAAEIRLELTSSDLEQTLETAGYVPALTGEKGRFVVDLAWAGGLRSDLVTAMEGTARLELEEGRLTAVDTGAGRIFGLLSLQALPRRLTLDFSDVFSGGLLYDRIEGDFDISGGDAYTTNLLLRGPTVDMGVVGRIGLADRDYDQTAVVSADLGAAVPVAGVIAGGPIVGAALWVLSEALKNPLRTQVTYRITGPWDAPVVERAASGTQAPTGTKPPSGPSPEPPPAQETRP